MSKAKDQATTTMVPVRIPAALRQRAKIYAARAGSSLQDVLTEAVEEYLKKRGA